MADSHANDAMIRRLERELEERNSAVQAIIGNANDSERDLNQSEKETLEGLKNAEAIAKVPGVTALFAASGDLGNFTGFRQSTPDYERAINIVHDATLKAGVRLCGPLAWRDRPDFTCFQAGSETAAIARGVAAELGPLTNTQGKPEVGPYAPKQ